MASLQAFSDTAIGWAIYNGELRHNSNSTGVKYGTSISPGDIIGVMLDMIDVRILNNNLMIMSQGTLSFSKNG